MGLPSLPGLKANNPDSRPLANQQALERSEVDRFGEVVIEAGLGGAAFVVLLAPARESDQHGAAAPGARPR